MKHQNLTNESLPKSNSFPLLIFELRYSRMVQVDSTVPTSDLTCDSIHSCISHPVYAIMNTVQEHTALQAAFKGGVINLYLWYITCQDDLLQSHLRFSLK